MGLSGPSKVSPWIARLREPVRDEHGEVLRPAILQVRKFWDPEKNTSRNEYRIVWEGILDLLGVEPDSPLRETPHTAVSPSGETPNGDTSARDSPSREHINQSPPNQFPLNRSEENIDSIGTTSRNHFHELAVAGKRDSGAAPPNPRDGPPAEPDPARQALDHEDPGDYQLRFKFGPHPTKGKRLRDVDPAVLRKIAAWSKVDPATKAVIEQYLDDCHPRFTGTRKGAPPGRCLLQVRFFRRFQMSSFLTADKQADWKSLRYQYGLREGEVSDGKQAHRLARSFAKTLDLDTSNCEQCGGSGKRPGEVTYEIDDSPVGLSRRQRKLLPRPVLRSLHDPNPIDPVKRDTRKKVEYPVRYVKAKGEVPCECKLRAGTPYVWEHLLGRRHRDVKLDPHSFVIYHQSQIPIVSELRRYDQLLEKGGDAKSLLLHGPSGTGKDHLMRALVKAVVIGGRGAIVISGTRMFQQFRGSFGDEETTEEQLMERFVRTDLLAVSDLIPFAGSLSDYEIRIFAEIVDRRYNRPSTNVPRVQ